jgi:hydrogenase nickel incorporation protein HypA/HybF
MHELAIAQAILDTAVERAAGRRIDRVDVRIGYLRQVVPSSLLFSWQLLTEATGFAGAELHIEHVPAVVACAACGRESTLAAPVMSCPACGGVDVALIRGTEFQIASIERASEVR